MRKPYVVDLGQVGPQKRTVAIGNDLATSPPRALHRDARRLKLPRIPRHHCQTVLGGGRGDQHNWVGETLPACVTGVDQQPPFSDAGIAWRQFFIAAVVLDHIECEAVTSPTRAPKVHGAPIPDSTLVRPIWRSAFELERHLELGPVGLDLALFDHEILLEDFGDAQIAQRFAGALDGDLGGLFP